jgi:hypothetical protein
MEDKIHETPMPPSTFKKLIAYFYLKDHMFGSDENSEIFVNFGDARWILHLADFYLLQNEKQLLAFCKERSSEITSKNWMEALKFGAQLDQEALRDQAIEVAINSGIPLKEALCLYGNLLAFSWKENRKLP